MEPSEEPTLTNSELEETIAALRVEIERLRAELARLRRGDHEIPPHWG